MEDEEFFQQKNIKHMKNIPQDGYKDINIS